MDEQIFDTVKYEKAKAMARFNRFRRIAKLWQVLEVVVVLVFLSWWTKKMPAALKFSGEFLLRASACIFNPHVVFLIGNAIIVALFVLCKQSNAADVSDGDLYDEYSDAQRRLVSASEAQAAPLSSSPEETEMIATDDGREKDIEEENEKRLQIVVAENFEPEAKCEEPVVMAIAKAEEQIRKFQRTQSERLRREIAVRPQRELRRSETENRRRVTSSVETVEALSNEEFKLAVDAFIDKHQRFFKEQKIAELKQLKM